MTIRDTLLLRHGKSDWGQPSPDIARPLKSRGSQQRYRQHRWLSSEAATERVSQAELKPLILKLAKEVTRRERR